MSGIFDEAIAKQLKNISDTLKNINKSLERMAEVMECVNEREYENNG